MSHATLFQELNKFFSIFVPPLLFGQIERKQVSIKE